MTHTKIMMRTPTKDRSRAMDNARRTMNGAVGAPENSSVWPARKATYSHEIDWFRLAIIIIQKRLNEETKTAGQPAI